MSISASLPAITILQRPQSLPDSDDKDKIPCPKC